MAVENIFNWFLIISAIHGFLFSIYLLFSKYRIEKSIIYLNLLILAITFNNLQSWVLAKHFFYNSFFLSYIHIPWHFLIAPFFYMFLIHYLKISNQSKKILKILIPIFVLMICVRIIFVFLFKENNDSNTIYLFEKYTAIEEIISLIVSLSVFIYSYYILKNRRQLFTEILSYDSLKWIYTFFKLGAFTYLFWITALSITVYLNFSQFVFAYYPLRVLTTVLIYWIGYQSIIQLRLLKERKNLRKLILLDKFKPNIDFLSTVDDKEHQEDFKIINAYITTHKAFLQAKYSIDDLSKELNMPTNKLSLIINSIYKDSFSNYMNSLRVDYAKKLLVDSKYADYTIVSIGLESGFNSKSSFYLVFKKHTTYTPTQFQKNSSNL